MKLLLTLLILLDVQVSQASEIHWVGFNINLRYSDSQVSCHNFSTSGTPIVDGSASLSLEIDGNNIISAQLNNFPNSWPYNIALYKSLRLSPAEIKGIQLFRDPKGTIYLKQWNASDEVVKWFAFYATELALLCHPPQILRTITPVGTTFDFETEGLSEGVEISYSNWQKFSGQRLDNRAYDLNLQLVQKKYLPDEGR